MPEAYKKRFRNKQKWEIAFKIDVNDVFENLVPVRKESIKKYYLEHSKSSYKSMHWLF